MKKSLNFNIISPKTFKPCLDFFSQPHNHQPHQPPPTISSNKPCNLNKSEKKSSHFLIYLSLPTRNFLGPSAEQQRKSKQECENCVRFSRTRNHGGQTVVKSRCEIICLLAVCGVCESQRMNSHVDESINEGANVDANKELIRKCV
jgi:hypothetical protein